MFFGIFCEFLLFDTYFMPLVANISQWFHTAGVVYALEEAL